MFTEPHPLINVQHKPHPTAYHTANIGVAAVIPSYACSVQLARPLYFVTMDGAITERPCSSANTVPVPAVGSDAKSTRFPLEGIRLTVHILGSRNSGRSTLYNQWCDSSVCAALSRFADVQVKLEVTQYDNVFSNS